jgi:glycosyltransferase involved in cell wall biosynthesis
MRVLQYYNWGYFEPIASGADLIAANQLEYFRKRGWEVDILLQDHPDRSCQAEAFHARYPWVRSVRLASPDAKEFSFRSQLFAHEQIAQSALFQELVRERHDLFLTSYAFSAPLAVPLHSGCKKVLEALDIVTSSFALAQGRRDSPRQPMARACDAFSWQLEAELYRLFDRILFINEEESRIVEPLCPGKTVAVPPMMPWEQLAEDDDSNKQMFEPSSSGSLDLIFVGSSAPLNVDGFKFFYYKIFVPYLRKHKVTVGVVGSVCDHLKFDDFYVTKFGNIPGDLRGYYERSKVVIIPILGGSGLSIKTIECLANGRAVVTSPMGARGLRPDPESFVRFDMAADPVGAAGTILDLLSSEPKRARMQKRAREYYRANFGPERYFETMDRVLASLGILSATARAEECRR